MYYLYKINSTGTGQPIPTGETDPETGEPITQIDPLRPAVAIPGGWKTGGKCPHEGYYLILCQCDLAASDDVEPLTVEQFQALAEHCGFSEAVIGEWVGLVQGGE